ncbi:MAG TPA: 4-hydroxybenzoate 3-monooxygenase [Solirubrobacteraceae bacterium]
METQVGIVGAGPAGLVLAHLLHAHGIESVVLEARSREYVEKRVRAGVLEQGTVDTLRDSGVGERLDREGLVHHGVELRFAGRGHLIDLSKRTGGKAIWLYGQQEVVKDLIAAREQAGAPLLFEVSDVRVDGLEGDRPRIRFTHEGAEEALRCDVVAGCDGFHGVCRELVPDLVTRERVYPYAWLGILAEVGPSYEELIYTHHERGFALASMRSPTITRLYLQVAPDEDIEQWSDDRIWSELHTRLATNEGFELVEGPVIEKGITPMRSFVAGPMRHGRLFLAGDAAHIVPPTGAKGLNLALADVTLLARALASLLRDHDPAPAAAYSDTSLARVWRATHFSWWMTSMLHVDPAAGPFDAQLQLAQLRYVVSSRAAATSLAENYTGYHPLHWP